MAYTPLAARRLTPEQEAFLRAMPDDTNDPEEACWIVMGSGQFWASTRLAESLETYAVEEGQPWFVGGMLPILYREPGTAERKQVAPDVLVAFVPRGARQLPFREGCAHVLVGATLRPGLRRGRPQGSPLHERRRVNGIGPSTRMRPVEAGG